MVPAAVAASSKELPWPKTDSSSISTTISFPRASSRSSSRWPAASARLVNDRISITLNPDIADLDAHLRAMDHAGVDVAVLTQSGVSVLGPATCRTLNDGLAEVAARYPDRIVPCAHVDLEDEGAVEELDRCVESLGYRVVALPCSTPTLDLDDPSLDPLWARLDALALPVILHPAQLPRGASLDYGLERSCARPFDTTVAAVRLMGGVLERYPRTALRPAPLWRYGGRVAAGGWRCSSRRPATSLAACRAP